MKDINLGLPADLEWLAIKEIEQLIIDEEGNEPEQELFYNDYVPLPNVYRRD